MQNSDRRKLLILLAAVTLARMLYAATMPMISGECYYWLWNWHPAAGYFDHPPMVGLIGVLLGGHVVGSPLMARLPAIVLSIFSTLAIYGLGKSMFPAGRTAWYGALLFTLAPILDLNGMFLSPDNSLALFTSLSWLTFWLAAENPRRLMLWIAAGIAGGLALLSKFHAWVLLPPLYAFLLFSPSHRKILKMPGPWLALIISLAVLSPNLYWNAEHDWMNYAFQWRRSALPRAHFNPLFMLQYALGPLATLSPLVYVAVLAGVWRAIKLWRASRDPRWLYLLCAGLPLPLFLGALTPLTQISLHWPAPAYGALLVLVAALHEEQSFLSPSQFRGMLNVMFLCTALLHAAPFALPFLPDATSSPKLAQLLGTDRARQKAAGWPEIGKLARKQRTAMQKEKPGTPVVIMAPNWHTTSSILFYAKLPLQGCPLNDEDLHNYRLWVEPRHMLLGADAVVVIENEEPNELHARLRYKYDKYHRMLDPLFESVKEQPSLICFPDGSTSEYMGTKTRPARLREFLIFRCTGFKGHFLDEGGLSQ